MNISKLFAGFTVLALVQGCGQAAPPTPASDTPSPPSLTLATIGPAVAFRYLDPTTGEPATASRIEDIPQAARREAVVYDPEHPAPAGWDFVADLTDAPPVTAVARRNFAFVTRAASTPGTATGAASAATNQAHEVVLFSTEGCGYCAKARRYLTSQRVPFTELDLEVDAAAPGRLRALGQAAGLSARDLQGVPILFIDGAPVLGWDEPRVAHLLGLGRGG